MQIQTCDMFWRMVLVFSLLCFGLAVPVSGQCFPDDNGRVVGPSRPSTDITDNGSIDFAISLFKNVAKTSLPSSGNCHISPISVRMALILTYMGAKGTTKAQMQTALRLDNASQKQVLQKVKAQKAALVHNATQVANYTLNIADKLYFDKDAHLRACMVENLATDQEQLDFRSAAEPSRSHINTWVENITNKKITNLLPVGSVTSDTTMVIVNAVYLRAAWAATFQPRATFDDDFLLEPQGSKKVKMMSQKVTIPYGSSTLLDCTAVEMPYSGNDISMVILLPNTNVEDLVSKLSAANLNDLFSKLSSVRVDLKVPKFKITQSFELSQSLQDMGMADLFDITKADLSGFTGSRNTFVTSVQHKTFIEVNEGGTEAAAATAVVIGTTSVIVSATEFKANRPFIFAIRNIKLKSILFFGMIKDPTATD